MGDGGLEPDVGELGAGSLLWRSRCTVCAIFVIPVVIPCPTVPMPEVMPRPTLPTADFKDPPTEWSLDFPGTEGEFRSPTLPWRLFKESTGDV